MLLINVNLCRKIYFFLEEVDVKKLSRNRFPQVKAVSRSVTCSKGNCCVRVIKKVNPLSDHKILALSKLKVVCRLQIKQDLKRCNFPLKR